MLYVLLGKPSRVADGISSAYWSTEVLDLQHSERKGDLDVARYSNIYFTLANRKAVGWYEPRDAFR